MQEIPAPEVKKQFIDMRPNTFVQVMLLGVGVGLAAWLLTTAIDHLIVRALVCGGASVACGGASAIAGNVSLILVSIAGLLGLIRLGTYRPLLVVIASAVILWGLANVTFGMMWYESLAWTMLLFGITYATLSWLVRPRLFFWAIVLIIAVVAAARLLPVLL